MEDTKSVLTDAGSSQSAPARPAFVRTFSTLRFDTMVIEVGAHVDVGTPVLGTLTRVLVVRLGPMGTLTQVLDVGLGGRGALRCGHRAARNFCENLMVFRGCMTRCAGAQRTRSSCSRV